MPYKNDDERREYYRNYMRKRRAQDDDEIPEINYFIDITLRFLEQQALILDRLNIMLGLTEIRNTQDSGLTGFVRPDVNPTRHNVNDLRSNDDNIMSGFTENVIPIVNPGVLQDLLNPHVAQDASGPRPLKVEVKEEVNSLNNLSSSLDLNNSSTINSSSRERGRGERKQTTVGDVDDSSVVVNRTKRTPQSRSPAQSIREPVVTKNGFLARIGKCPYEETLGEEVIREIAQKLVKFDEAMGSTGWVRKLLRYAYDEHQVELNEKQIRGAVTKLFKGLEQNKGKISSPSGWARTTFAGLVAEVGDE